MKALVVALVVVAGATPAAAQVCHLAPLEERGAPDQHHAHGAAHHLQLGLHAVAADLAGGAYQGVIVTATWHREPVGVTVSAPFYRLEHDGMTARGPGDVAAQAHVALVGGARWRAGAALAGNAPTGDADDRIGAGHVMLMPGAWAAARRGRAEVVAAASVGIAVGGAGGAHHHHHAPGGSLVSPMSSREVGGAVRAAWAATRRLTPHASAAIAVPIGDGTTYAIAGVGAGWQRAGWALLAEAALGVVGEPFQARGTFGVARSF